MHKGSSIKCVRTGFAVLVLVSPLYVHIRFESTPLPPSLNVWILFFKEDVTEIYVVNYYQSKNQKKRYKNKETTVQSSRKMSSQNARKNPGYRDCAF